MDGNLRVLAQIFEDLDNGEPLENVSFNCGLSYGEMWDLLDEYADHHISDDIVNILAYRSEEAGG